MRTRPLIKIFQFREQDRSDVTLGTDTRINPSTHRAQLKATAGLFPTTADLFVISRLTTPLALRKLTGFYTVTNEPTGTTILYRMFDGTTERYWDGAAWSAAGAGDWNIEQDIVDNIGTYDIETFGQSFAVVANLETTDSAVTPELIEVRFLYDGIIEYQEDIIYRSLVPELRDNIRPISREVVAMPVTGTVLNISDLGLEPGYNVVDVDSVLDFDANPGLINGFPGSTPDLLSSFVVGTGVITLTGAVTAGVNLWIRFIYEPEIAVKTSQDFIEQARVPAVEISEIELINGTTLGFGQCFVADKGAATATVIPPAIQGDLQITLLQTTEKQVDHQRLQEQINKFFAENTELRSRGLDERYRMFVVEQYSQTGVPGQNELYVGRAVLQIQDFKQWINPAYAENIITSGADITFSFTSC